MRIFDIRAIAARAKAAGAKVAVDNTFLSPALQRPIVLGADFVIHSTTKFVNGHSDVIGGAVIAADKADVDALSAWANLTGVMGAPFDSYMTLRGLRAKMVIAKIPVAPRATDLLAFRSAMRQRKLRSRPLESGLRTALVHESTLGSWCTFPQCREGKQCAHRVRKGAHRPSIYIGPEFR